MGARVSSFPSRIFVADMAPASGSQTEVTFAVDASKVAGLPVRAYVPEPEIEWESLAHAEAHPLRISILEVLTLDGGRMLSPNEMAFELQERLGNTSYHVGKLTKAGFLELVTTVQRRGAAEHYYRLTPKGGGGEATDQIRRDTHRNETRAHLARKQQPNSR